MSPRGLTVWLTVPLTVLAVVCVVLRAWLNLDPRHAPSATRILTVWEQGRTIARQIFDRPVRESDGPACTETCTRIVERVVDDGPLPTLHPFLFAVSIAAGRDGIAASLGDRTAYLTADDLLARQATSQGAHFDKLELRLGLNDPEAVMDALAEELHTQRAELLAHGRWRRFIVRRESPPVAWPQPTTSIAPAMLKESIVTALTYLVRNQRDDGSFHYLLDATQRGEEEGGSWPRHAGATLTLATGADRMRDRTLSEAAVRAARLLQRNTVDCGSQRCIGDTTRVGAGSSALALLAYVELTRAGLSSEFQADIRALAAFLRSLQRPDGQFMHVFDRALGHAEDIQQRYFSGETVLALARAARVTGDAEDLRAASRGLHRIARRSLIQNRYFFGQEHWLCQALEELWDRAPDRDALAFCIDHQAFNRLQQCPGTVVDSFDGGYAPHPFSPPRVAATGSRTEGAIATLNVARAAGVNARDIERLETQVRAGLRFMLRHQLRPGPTYLLADPARVYGGMPGSPTDLGIRIDYQQHVTGAMLRYLALIEPLRH